MKLVYVLFKRPECVKIRGGFYRGVFYYFRIKELKTGSLKEKAILRKLIYMYKGSEKVVYTYVRVLYIYTLPASKIIPNNHPLTLELE